MRLPFSVEQFLDVFSRYNLAVWPAQILLVAIAMVAIVVAGRPNSLLCRVPMLALAVLWVWMGVVYHAGFFRAINPAAVLFGTLFVIQGLMFAWEARSHGVATAPPDRVVRRDRQA